MRTLLFIALISLQVSAHADNRLRYEVTITNATPGQAFTPQLIATHARGVALFDIGAPASTGLEILAEGGDTAPLTEALRTTRGVGTLQTVPGLLLPGKSVSVVIETSFFHQHLSIAAMLIPTNDTYVAVSGLRLPAFGEETVQALAYDAGTEANDQNCRNIPGPRCGGEGYSPGPNDGDEGFVHVSNGFHALSPLVDGDVLAPAHYDWRNPVAIVMVKRLR
ncbi:MAG: hypothetical protein HC809_03225 [Gammaproteobacteria bacterium]|nr:hypothetical protein [Gammaproteobacteria bacterium]